MIQPRIKALIKDKIVVGHAVFNDLSVRASFSSPGPSPKPFLLTLKRSPFSPRIPSPFSPRAYTSFLTPARPLINWLP